jgi:hypothetical protein
MWGATDLAFILWCVLRVPGVPFLAQIRIVATVIDAHVSTCASAFLSTFAMPLLALLRPGYYATPLGSLLLTVHINSIWILIGITMCTGAVYEWYASEMVRVCKRGPAAAAEYPPVPAAGGCCGGGGGGAGAGAAAAPSLAIAEAGGLLGSSSSSSGGGGGGGGGGAAFDGPAPSSDALGTLPICDRSMWGRLRSGAMTHASVLEYALKMLPWAWAPITAVVYMLAPASVAQTKLMFQNRMRKAHVSPKSSPTPVQTPRPGAATPTVASLGGGGVGESPTQMQQVVSALEAFAPSARTIKLQLPAILNFGRRAED